VCHHTQPPSRSPSDLRGGLATVLGPTVTSVLGLDKAWELKAGIWVSLAILTFPTSELWKSESELEGSSRYHSRWSSTQGSGLMKEDIHRQKGLWGGLRPV
jgi:hypothetical protein